MLLQRWQLEGIQDGRISLAFRRWQRPTVQSGGSLLTPIGQLHLGKVSIVTLQELTTSDARAAGFNSVAALRAKLRERPDGKVYRIEIEGVTEDPRVALREQRPDPASLADLIQTLARMDLRSKPAWTSATLRLIGDRPGCPAADLCRLLDMDKARFKARVRRLKRLGLTESLRTGYRLSPRGEALLRAITAAG